MKKLIIPLLSIAMLATLSGCCLACKKNGNNNNKTKTVKKSGKRTSLSGNKGKRRRS